MTITDTNHALSKESTTSEHDISGTSLPSDKRLAIFMRIFGVLSLVAGGTSCVMFALKFVNTILHSIQNPPHTIVANISILLASIETVLTATLAVFFVVFGVRLLKQKRHIAALLAIIMIVITLAIMLSEIMQNGLSGSLIPYAILCVFLIVTQSYLDPSLMEERELQRHLRDMETRDAMEEGTLGLDESGKGYIALNFFNLFWIFTVCCVLGLIIETIYHFFVVDPGHYQDRAGMLFGPFSPIYGFGAVLMTVALNRFHNKNIILIFLVSALIGGAFEYLTSWFMQFAFGAVAWDYTGTFLSIDGRTNGMFMAMWGVLGVVWIKVCLPWMLKLVNLIPWNWRYSITALCALLMIVDGVMTLMALDCWYQRLADNSMGDSAVVSFFNEHFDNNYMQERFQSMSLYPDEATRIQ